MTTQAPEAPEVAKARIEAERARGQMMDTAHQLQERLSPSNIANRAWTDAKNKGVDMAAKGAGLAEEAVIVARERPKVAGGVAAAAVLFLMRNPLMRLARKVTGGSADKGKRARSKSKNTETEVSE